MSRDDRTRSFIDRQEPRRILNFTRFQTAVVDTFDAYRETLERDPDPLGCAGYAWALLLGSRTKEEIVAEMLGSDEWKAKHPPAPSVPPVPPWHPEGITGAPRPSGNRSFRDDAGDKLFVGLSRFYWLWAWKHDRDRVLQEMALDREAGYRYVRVLAQVQCQGNDQYWAGREVDPNWPDLQEQIANLTQAAVAHGLVLLWTLIGKGGQMNTQSVRAAHVRRCAQVLREVSGGVLVQEIMNEPMSNGYITLGELLDLQALAKQEAPMLMTATGAVWTEAGWVTDFPEFAGATGFSPEGWRRTQREVGIAHLDRDTSRGEGVDRPWRQGWDVGLESMRWIDNEHIGPGSSVNSENRGDVLRSMRTVSFICRAFASCLHGSPGVRGLTLWEETPGYREAPKAVRFLPGNLPDGRQINSNQNYPDRPFSLENAYCRSQSGRGIVRAYSNLCDGVFYTVPFGPVSDFKLRVERPLHVECYRQDVDDRLWERDVNAGEDLEFAGNVPDYLLVSRPL